MHRKLRSLTIGTVLGTALALLTAGCVDDKSTLFIMGVLYREPPGCTAENDPSNTFLGSGTLDVALRSSYQATLLIGNQYTPRGSKDNLRTETTRVTLQGAEVRLTQVVGNKETDLGDAFTVTGSGFAFPNKGEDPGYGLFDAEVIPSSMNPSVASTDRALNETITAHIKVFGQTTGGQDIDSGEFSFPIKICYGCLVKYPLKAISDSGSGPECLASVEDVPESGCRPGQDDFVDCRYCSASNPEVCRTVYAASP